MHSKNSDISFSVKSMQENGVFSGYASVFGVVDSQNDVIMQGAFARSLKRRAGEVKLLWQHQVDEPIGVFTVIREDSHGLYVEGRLLLDLQRGKEAYSLLKNGAINGLSIGYSVVDVGYNAENNIRLIKEVELWEVSLVTFPANEAAVVMGVKNLGKNKKSSDPHHCALTVGVDSAIVDSIDRAINVLVY